MGDRVHVAFTFGGKASEATTSALLELLEDEGFTPGYVEVRGTSAREALETGGAFECDEINYAETPEIDAFCKKNKIDFDKSHDAGGGYSGSRIHLRDGVLSSIETNREGAPVIPLEDVLKVESLATGLADLLAKAKAWNDPLKPFEIVS